MTQQYVAPTIILMAISFTFSGCVSLESLDSLDSEDTVRGCESSGRSNEMNPHCNPSPVSIADGIAHGSLNLNPCIIRNGQVKCWGENTYGQLGFASPTSNVGDGTGEMGENLASTNLGSDAFVHKVVASNAGSRCALLSDNTVKCWVMNGSGHLGYGDLTDRNSHSVLGNLLPPIKECKDELDSIQIERNALLEKYPSLFPNGYDGPLFKSEDERIAFLTRILGKEIISIKPSLTTEQQSLVLKISLEQNSTKKANLIEQLKQSGLGLSQIVELTKPKIR